MKGLILLCGLIAVINAASFSHPFPRGYHIDVGIPLAKRVYAIETEVRDGSKIANGRPSPLANHPYLAGVLSDVSGSTSFSICTASLISSIKLITAAHNWKNTEVFAESGTVVLGSESIFSGGTRIYTDKVDLHPGYFFTTLINDIAIVTIDEVTFIPNVIQPVALPVGNLQNNDFSDVWVRAAGYGRTESGLPPPVRQEVDLQVISNEECRQFFGNAIFDSTICTRSASGEGICSGDSGGPLSIQNGPERVLIGVTSFNGGCGNPMPNGFARVTYFLPWILERL